MMADVKMIELLEKYKSLAVLWNHSLEIINKPKIRQAAWEELLKTYKTIDENADIPTLKHKIDNLRSSYKRERKKVLTARLKGQHHTPRLWYYKLLLFVDGADEDEDESSISIMSNDESHDTNYTNCIDYDRSHSEDNSGFSGMLEQMLRSKKVLSVSKRSCSSPAEDVRPTPQKIFRPTTPINSRPSTPRNSRPSTPRNSRPSTPASVFLKAEDSDDSAYIVNVGNEEIIETNSKETEAAAYGRIIGLQLAELDPMQKIIAEKLISEVIYYARLHKLGTETTFKSLNQDCFL